MEKEEKRQITDNPGNYLPFFGGIPLTLMSTLDKDTRLRKALEHLAAGAGLLPIAENEIGDSEDLLAEGADILETWIPIYFPPSGFNHAGVHPGIRRDAFHYEGCSRSG